MPASHFPSLPLKVPHAIVEILIESGVDMVFGVPGGNSMLIYDGLYDYRNKIRPVLVRHESLAGVMAEVYGRLTGKPGVAIGQGLFMLSNALLGVLEAKLGSAPMLILSDLTDGAPFSQHAPYQSGTGEYGNWDAKCSFAAVSKAVFESHRPVQAVQHTQLAIKHATTGRNGPVAVLYHSQALAGPLDVESVPQLFATSGYLVSEARFICPQLSEEVLKTIAEARKPVIIAGNGVRLSRGYEELRRLSETLAVPVATTAAGKGVYTEDHPLALGVFGTFGLPAANDWISNSDLILAIGTQLAPSDTAFENPELIDPSRQTLIQIDIEPRNIGWTFPCEIALNGDAAALMAVLQSTAASSGLFPAERNAERYEEIRVLRERQGYFNEREYAAEKTPLLPQRIIAEIMRVLPKDSIITCDAGENRLFMTRYFQVRSSGGFLSPAATGGMGYAIPAALASKLVAPGRTAMAVCGDGGFAMSMSGLITAREEKIPIVVLVMNNQALGWVKHFQRDRVISSEFQDLDIAGIAKAMGCAAFRVETAEELAIALMESMKLEIPAVIDVATSLEVSFRDILSPLARRG